MSFTKERPARTQPASPPDSRSSGGGRDAGAKPPSAPQISVIIPAFNVAATIDDTLRSVLRQRGATWEAIVVDDGSTDGSRQVVEAVKARDGRIKLLSQENRGAASARNRGIQAARGEWLCFLDGDDWLAPRAFARLLRLAGPGEPAVLLGRTVRVSADGRRWTYPFRDLFDAFSVLSADCPIAIHSALVRRSVVVEAGGFDESLRSSEDWDLWQRIARAGHRFAQTRAKVALYRARPGSLSRQLPSAAHEGLRVLRRGHQADPRVRHPAPSSRAGAPASDLPTRELYYLLWAAARDVAAGGDGVSTAALLDHAVDSDFDPEVVGELMAAGMADLLARRPSELGPDWAKYERPLSAVLDAICPGSERARLRGLALASIRAHLDGGRPRDPDVLQLDGPPSAALAPPPDYAALQLRSGRATGGLVSVPLLGPRSATDIRQLAVEQTTRLRLGPALRALHPWRTLAFWTTAAAACLRLRGLGLWGRRGNPRLLLKILRARARYALSQGLQAAVQARLAPGREPEPSPHARALAALEAQIAAQVGERPAAAPPPPSESDTGREPAAVAESRAWDAFFAEADPWNYAASAYEQLKYEDTLELVPDTPHGEALELACAEGHFTPRLSRRVGRVLATDISAAAVERAAERCRGLENVGFSTLDFMRRPLPGRYDVIVCSEVLYYAGGRLRAVAEKLAQALRPGGVLVMAHAETISDAADATGFDWGGDYGARTIAETFAAVPGLALEREIRRPLYRVQAFRKQPGAAAVGGPQREERPLQVALEPAVARAVVWGGGESRLAALRREASVRVPVLMYHRVSPDPGPEALERYRIHPDVFGAQMALLRRQGFWGLTPERLAQALARNEPLPGRPVMITFDDGYRDLADHAWPHLARHDLPATVFVVGSRIGGTADWDAACGPPSPLMGWDTLRTLAREGLSIGSHAYSHRPLTRLPVAEVYEELIASRELIRAEVGSAPTAVCYPYGAADAVVEQIAHETGFALGFTVASGFANLACRPLHLPRIEVAGWDDVASFARKVGIDTPPGQR